MIDSGIKAIILRAYGSGDIPNDLVEALKYARNAEVPVVVTTQCPEGITKIGLNVPGSRALEYGIIPAYDMSIEYQTTKLAWLLAKSKKGELKYETYKK